MISPINCSIVVGGSRHLGGKLVPRPSRRWRQWRSVTICRELKHSDQTIKSEHVGTDRPPARGQECPVPNGRASRLVSSVDGLTLVSFCIGRDAFRHKLFSPL